MTLYRVPALRHLAWMHQAGQLFQGPQSVHFSEPLPVAMMAKFSHWDAFPEEGPALLTATPHPRLGLYFEQLYACLMGDILGWEVLARNLPVRRNGITLGELDFVLRNPHTQAIEHHEIAVKFYLGYPTEGTGSARWYGPNSSDRLDIKTRRLLEHQSQLTRRPETVAALADRGLTQPQRCRIFMPGYLFYPASQPMPPPLQAPQNHQRGSWLYLDQARTLDRSHWVPLRKPHWLGPWLQPAPPFRAEAEAALEQVQASGTPRLFARLDWVAQTGCWQEVARFFVVPGHWPGKKEAPIK